MNSALIYYLIFFFNFLIAAFDFPKYEGSCQDHSFPESDILLDSYFTENPNVIEREIEDGTFDVYSSDLQGYIETDFIHYDTVLNNNIYIESSYYNSLDLNTIDEIVNAFAVINNYSLLNNMSIRESEETLLGISPTISNQVNLLFLDIQDGYDPSSGNNSYTAGFFDPNDQIPGGLGNDANIIYIDVYPNLVINEKIQNILFTLSHEYQHLLHWNIDVCEGNFDWLNETTVEAVEAIYNCTPSNKWVNEGLSDIIGYLHSGVHRDFTYYTNNMSVGLDSWPHPSENVSQLTYYSKSALFFHYLYQNFGFDIISDIFLNQRKQGIEGVIDVVEDYSNFNAVFKGFISSIIKNSIYNISLDNVLEDYLISELPIQDGVVELDYVYIGEPYSSHNGYFASNYYLENAHSGHLNQILITANGQIYDLSSSFYSDFQIDYVGGGYVSAILFSNNNIEIDLDLQFDVLIEELYIYPNPINPATPLSILFFPSSIIENINLYTIQGRLVTAIPVGNTNYISYELKDNLSSGVYFIGYNSNQNSYKKLTILK